MMDEQDEIQSSFDRSAAIVRKLLKYIEQAYVYPAGDFLSEVSRDRPIFTTLVGIFSILSVLPIVSFAGFSLFVLASCIFVSLAGGLILATAIVLLSAGLLAALLSFLFIVALSLTTGATSVYLFLRFAVLATNEGPLIGLSEWIQETKWSLLGVGHTVTVEMREQKAEDDAHSVAETLTIDAGAVEAQAYQEEIKVQVPGLEADQDAVVVVKEEGN